MPVMARIIGTGCYLPEKVLTNQDFEKMVETSDEWISSRTGIKERRIAAQDEFTSDMGYKAALAALKDADLSPEEVDLVLVATITPDCAFPSTSCKIQHRLGATKAAAFDMQAACSGYIYGLSLAKALVEAKVYKNILLIASEKLSSIVNYEDRNTCVLFGDGASACVISDHPGKNISLCIRDISLGSDGEQANLITVPAGGSCMPASLETVSAKLHYLQMEGKEVFKHAVRRMEAACKECIDRVGLKEEEISETIAKRFNIPMERVYLTIHKYGNTSASSVGIALHELLEEKRLSKGANILLTAFGSGLTWGACILTKENEGG
jgi:3-oxoacyl-[acyl-carrier-protein] synthase III